MPEHSPQESEYDLQQPGVPFVAKQRVGVALLNSVSNGAPKGTILELFFTNL